MFLCLFHDEVHIRYITQAPNAFSLIKNTLCAIIFCFVPQVIPKICVFSIYFYFYIVLPTSSCFCRHFASCLINNLSGVDSCVTYGYVSIRQSGQTHQNYSDKNCNISNCKTLIINVLDLLVLDIFRIFIV